MNTSKLVVLCLAAMLGLTPAAQAKRSGGDAAGGAASTEVARDAGPKRQETQATVPVAVGADESDAGVAGSSVGVVAGLATGLGVAGFFHGFGVGPQAAGWFSFAVVSLLLALLGWVLWRLLKRSAGVAPASLAFQSATPPAARSSFASSHYEPATLAPESSVHYGAGGIEEVASRTGEFRWGVPAGFDAAGFLQSAKSNFVLLQEAWDRADIETLRLLMTDDMLGHIRLQLDERGDQPNRTDVVTLNAEMLGVEDIGTTYIASVEFSGMIREEVTAGAAPFREVWNLTKPKDGSAGWLLAGVQALQ
ncbi:Tim44-like domain-containing protein [Schlegelella sp. S2-27]|uniref:Tim44-like domain-containing protein n=1 Tax=Caldimonas mangrovi TaxID=2944811 RepID=A0ABT0YU34_9BURK|nr:Tim44-like domain-containing protein [Caldimonas mangrovi]MCM5681348.1 Tim44-like domain-containing protein [Caldimonas mangrovi]